MSSSTTRGRHATTGVIVSKNEKTSRVRIAWTDENNTLLRQLYSEENASWDKIQTAFPHANLGALKQQVFRLSLKRSRVAAVKPADRTLYDQLVEFLSRARTEKEIVSKYGAPGKAELASLAQNPPEGHRLQESRNAYQEKTVYLERVLSAAPIKSQPRIFTVRESENDPDFRAIFFPRELDFTNDPSLNAIRILPIDSLAFGDYLCDEEEFKKILRRLAAKPYVFAYLNGNIIGGSNYTKETAAEIRERLRRYLAPVAHKILWAQSGPLEARMSKVDGVEPLHAICSELDIHHTDRPVRADIYWKFPTRPVEIYTLHGRSQARKDGAKANAITDAVVNQNFPHFTVMGHLREGMANVHTVRRLDPKNLTIKEYPAYAIVCPGLQKYAGSEAEKKGYPPPAKGTVELVIYSDNRHEASS